MTMTLTQSLQRACENYNNVDRRSYRGENLKLDEDGVTVWSDGDGYRPTSVRDLLGWIAAGQWDAQGPDESIAPAEEANPVHRRLSSWWHARRRREYREGAKL